MIEFRRLTKILTDEGDDGGRRTKAPVRRQGSNGNAAYCGREPQKILEIESGLISR